MRDCASSGMTRDEIAEQCSFTVKQVDRVLAGGKLFHSADASGRSTGHGASGEPATS